MSDGHGSTPAAWTAVVLIIAGFAIGGLAMVVSVPTGLYIGATLVVIGPIIGKVMQLMRLGHERT
ncbi:MAG: HGxxPAAW family protein [Streptosporangiaceae bacterium]